MNRLILTCAGGRMMPALARRLKASMPGLRLIGTDADPAVVARGVSGFDRLVTVPRADEAGYIDSLLALGGEEDGCVLIPGSDEEALRIALNQRSLTDRGIALAATEHAMLERVSDKLELAHAVAGEAQALPARTPDEARSAVRSLSGPGVPVVLKPARGRGRRGVTIISDHPLPSHADLPVTRPFEDIDSIYAGDTPPSMAMRYVAGRALSADILADRGRPIQIVVREWLEGWRFPFPGQRVIRHDVVEGIVAHVAATFRLHGLLDMDFIAPKDGPPVLLEVNPRPSGSAVVSETAGIALFSMTADLARGRPVRATTVTPCIIAADDLDLS